MGGVELDDYVVERLLGKGPHGVTYKARRKADGFLCTIKEVDVQHMTEEEKEDAKEEIRVLAAVQNKNMVGYYDALLNDDRLYVVMEMYDQGDLAAQIRLRAEQRKYFTEAQIWSFFIQILRGLVALHSKGLIHRNITSGNIVQLDSNALKLGDVQVGKVKEGATAVEIGDPHYMPPEVWENKPYTFKSDVWALGCLFYEIITLTVPFGGCSLPDLRPKVIEAVYSPVPSSFSSGLSKVVKLLLNPDQSTRISAVDMLRHPLLETQLQHAPAADPLPRVRLADKANARNPRITRPPSGLSLKTVVAQSAGTQPKQTLPGRSAKLQNVTGSQKENSPATSSCKKPAPIPAPRAILSSPDNDAKLSNLGGTAKQTSKVRVPRVAMLGISPKLPLVKNGTAAPVSQAQSNARVNLKHFKTAYIQAPNVGGDEFCLFVNPNDHDRSDANRRAKSEGSQSVPDVSKNMNSSFRAKVTASEGEKKLSHDSSKPVIRCFDRS